MEGKKNWRILVGVAMILCMAMPNRVEASEENSHMIPILETVWVEENGEQGSRMGYRRRVQEVEKQYYFWIVAGYVLRLGQNNC